MSGTKGGKGLPERLQAESMDSETLSKVSRAISWAKVDIPDISSERWLIATLVDGLTHVFATIKVTPDIRNLPSNYQAVVEWARISLVFVSYHVVFLISWQSGVYCLSYVCCI